MFDQLPGHAFPNGHGDGVIFGGCKGSDGVDGGRTEDVSYDKPDKISEMTFLNPPILETGRDRLSSYVGLFPPLNISYQTEDTWFLDTTLFIFCLFVSAEMTKISKPYYIEKGEIVLPSKW